TGTVSPNDKKQNSPDRLFPGSARVCPYSGGEPAREGRGAACCAPTIAPSVVFRPRTHRACGDHVIPVYALLTENDLADEFVASFQARRLAEKFFYWFPLSVRAWLALCSDGAYRNFVRSRSLIARSAQELARYLPPGPLEVLSLGSGQGDKDLLLLEALRGNGSRVSYVPVDTSQALLEMACGGALGAGFPALGIKADFSRAEHLAALASDAESPPRLILLVGNTLGAFDPIAELRALRGLLRRED